MSCGSCNSCRSPKKCPCHIVDDNGIPLAGLGTECDPYIVPAAPDRITKVFDNGDHTWTVVHGDGTPPVTIDACACGVDGPTETVTTLTVNPTGELYTYTSEDGTVTVIDTSSAAETVTTLVWDPITNSFTYTNEAGTMTTVNFPTDSLVMTAPGVWTHTAVDGTIEIIDVCAAVLANCPHPAETVTTLTFDAVTGEYTYTSEDGTITVISPAGEMVTTLTHDAVNNEFTYTSEDGTVTTVPYCCDDIVTTFVHDAVAETITYTSEDGTITVVNLGDVITTLTHDAVNFEFTYTSEDGTVTTVPYCCDDTVTTFVHDTVLNTITYTSEDGTVTTVNLSETLTTLVSPSCGLLTYTGEDGVPNTVAYGDAGLSGATVTQDTAAGTVTITDGCSNEVVIPVGVIDADINNVTVNGSVITFTNEDGSTIDVDVCAIVAASCPGSTETTTTLTYDAVANTFTYTSEDSTITTVPLCCPDTVTTLVFDPVANTYTYTSEDGTVTVINPSGETTTTLALGAVCGTLAYTDEAGVTNNIVLPGLLTGITVADEIDGTATLTDSCGTEIVIPVSAPSVDNPGGGGAAPGNPPDTDETSIAYDSTTGSITHVWDVTNQVWVPAPVACCDVEWDSSAGGLPPNPPPNPNGPAEAYDPATGIQTHVWDTANQVWVASPCCRSKDVIYCGSADVAAGLPAAGDIVPAVFCQGDSLIESACATGMDVGLDGTVILDLIVDGASSGQTLTINPTGGAFAECIDLADIPLTGAGPHTVSWAVSGGTATTGTADGVTVEFNGHCA